MLITITHGSVFKDIIAAYNKCTVLDKTKMIRKRIKSTAYPAQMDIRRALLQKVWCVFKLEQKKGTTFEN